MEIPEHICQEVYDETGLDIIDIIMDIMENRATPSETMERISELNKSFFNKGYEFKLSL